MARAAKDGETDVQRRFREALERKQAASRSAPREEHLDGHGVGAANNTKHQRQFRRKSG
jgi:hypothetical protein